MHARRRHFQPCGQGARWSWRGREPPLAGNARWELRRLRRGRRQGGHVTQGSAARTRPPSRALGMLSWPSALEGAGDGGTEELGMKERGRAVAEEPGEEDMEEPGEEDVEEQEPGEEEDVEEQEPGQEDVEEPMEEAAEGKAAEELGASGGQNSAWCPGELAGVTWTPDSLHLQVSGPLHLRAGPWVQQELLPRCPPHLVTQRPPANPVPPTPQMAWEVTPSRMAVLSPWDPNYEVKTRSNVTWGPSCGSGSSFSNRTVYHPSFYTLYEVAGRGGPHPAPPGGHPHNRQPMPRDPGIPVMCREDFFLLDPLLPRGQRVPLYLAEPPQQAMGSMKLLVLPPVMTPWVCPSAPQGSSTTAWLSGPELIALTGLLQMSQGEQRHRPLEAPSASASASASASLPEPDSNPKETSGGQSCCDNTSPSVTQGPDSHGP
ncbi:histone deacetylase complex subunit SAP25 [Perognathus longimembris pacificus]|uniref:histone deacetylase complex subunit SAP25 n=1 Tax=Perognathus longimembris pacificus TaxID=214514 RepID=UPI002018D811|nr:histone deacetylase complex subunit SAP25 [Perognathus longimembris pacificus]